MYSFKIFFTKKVLGVVGGVKQDRNPIGAILGI